MVAHDHHNQNEAWGNHRSTKHLGISRAPQRRSVETAAHLRNAPANVSRLVGPLVGFQNLLTRNLLLFSWLRWKFDSRRLHQHIIILFSFGVVRLDLRVSGCRLKDSPPYVQRDCLFRVKAATRTGCPRPLQAGLSIQLWLPYASDSDRHMLDIRFTRAGGH